MKKMLVNIRRGAGKSVVGQVPCPLDLKRPKYDTLKFCIATVLLPRPTPLKSSYSESKITVVVAGGFILGEAKTYTAFKSGKTSLQVENATFTYSEKPGFHGLIAYGEKKFADARFDLQVTARPAGPSAAGSSQDATTAGQGRKVPLKTLCSPTSNTSLVVMRWSDRRIIIRQFRSSPIWVRIFPVSRKKDVQPGTSAYLILLLQFREA